MFDKTATPNGTSILTGSGVSTVRRSVLVACIAVFGLMTGQQMVNPILAPLARALGLSELALGLVMAVGATGVVFASGFWARRALAWGHRPVLLLSLWGAAIGLAAFAAVAQLGLSHVLPLWLLFTFVVLSRGVVFGLAWAATPATVQSYIAGATTGEAERVKGMSTFGAAQGLGLAVGPALGGVLSGAGILLPMYAAPIIVVVIAVGLLFALPRVSAGYRSDRVAARVRVLDRRVWPFLVIGFGLYGAITVVLMTMGFLLQDRMHVSLGQTGGQTGLITLAGAALIVVVQAVIVPRLAWLPYRLIRLGCVIMTMGMVVVTIAPTVIWLAAGVALLGAGLGFGMPGVSAAPSLLVSAAEQGSVAGLVTATTAMTFVIGPLVGDGLYELGTAVPYVVSAVMLATVTTFAFTYRGIRRTAV